MRYPEQFLGRDEWKPWNRRGRYRREGAGKFTTEACTAKHSRSDADHLRELAAHLALRTGPRRPPAIARSSRCASRRNARPEDTFCHCASLKEWGCFAAVPKLRLYADAPARLRSRPRPTCPYLTHCRQTRGWSRCGVEQSKSGPGTIAVHCRICRSPSELPNAAMGLRPACMPIPTGLPTLPSIEFNCGSVCSLTGSDRPSLVSIIKVGSTLGNCHLRQGEAILSEKPGFG
jgi:hypothetical protein